MSYRQPDSLVSEGRLLGEESAFVRLRSALSYGVHKIYEAFYPKTIGAS